MKARRVLRLQLTLKKELELPREVVYAVQEVERTHTGDRYWSRDPTSPHDIQFEVYWDEKTKRARVRVYTAYGEYEPKKAKVT